MKITLKDLRHCVFTKCFTSINNSDDFIIVAVLRIVNAQGYLTYLYADRAGEAELHHVPTLRIENWAEKVCQDKQAQLYSY